MTGQDSTTPPRPPFDPETVGPLEAMSRAVPLRMSDETLDELRRLMAEAGSDPTQPAPDLSAGGAVALTELEVPGPEGAPPLTLLVMTPAAGPGPWPCIYHIHGGGMVVGTRRAGLESLVAYVAEGKAVVVSVEYRLAPEHPHPAPVDDCYAGLSWVASHAGELGVARDRILILGASAGGGLAAATALMARDHTFPVLPHQVLICPMLDDREDSISARMLNGEGMADRNDNRYAWTALLGDQRGQDGVSPYVAPNRATDLANLPRTYIDVGSVETFRDPALDYARRLSEAGVSVDLHMWGGGTHGFDLWAPEARMSQASHLVRDEFIRRALTDGAQRARLNRAFASPGAAEPAKAQREEMSWA